MDSLVEQIRDERVVAQVRRQARRVSLKGLVAAVALTVLALALPG
jgi:hypothetical protein